jgi:hypothetical protein
VPARRKYPNELRERALRLVLDLVEEPGGPSVAGACTRAPLARLGVSKRRSRRSRKTGQPTYSRSRWRLDPDGLSPPAASTVSTHLCITDASARAYGAGGPRRVGLARTRTNSLHAVVRNRRSTAPILLNLHARVLWLYAAKRGWRVLIRAVRSVCQSSPQARSSRRVAS